MTKRCHIILGVGLLLVAAGLPFFAAWIFTVTPHRWWDLPAFVEVVLAAVVCLCGSIFNLVEGADKTTM